MPWWRGHRLVGLGGLPGGEVAAAGARGDGGAGGGGGSGGSSPPHGLSSVCILGFVVRGRGLRFCILGGRGRLPSTQGAAGERRVTGRSKGSKASDAGLTRSSHADRALGPSTISARLGPAVPGPAAVVPWGRSPWPHHSARVPRATPGSIG